MSNAEEIDILARTAWAEARSHGLDGMAAVLNVIANRAGRPAWWGKTLREVCKARAQFEAWNPEVAAKNRILVVDQSDPHFRDAMMLANALVNGLLRDRTGGATHYYAEYIPAPSWVGSHKPTLVVGPAGQRHFFYRIGPNG